MYDLAEMTEHDINELIERLAREDQEELGAVYVRTETMIEYTEE